MKIKKGDTVVVTRGKDKGRQGTVEKAFVSRGVVVVPGVNEYKKHVKRSATGKASEIVTMTRPLSVSVVALICPKCKKQTRVGYTVSKEGSKVRICRKCKKEI